MAKSKGFQMVKIVNTLTEISSMLTTALKKAGGEYVDENAIFADLQELVKRHGNDDFPSPVTASQQTYTYNLAADLLTSAVLSAQNGKKQTAISSFIQASSSPGIDLVLRAFEEYNSKAIEADQGVDPSVEDDQSNETEVKAPTIDEEDGEGNRLVEQMPPPQQMQGPPPQMQGPPPEQMPPQQLPPEQQMPPQQMQQGPPPQMQQGPPPEQLPPEQMQGPPPNQQLPPNQQVPPEQGPMPEEELPPEEEEGYEEENLQSKLHRLVKSSKSKDKQEAKALANKISQKGDNVSLKVIRAAGLH